MAGCLRLAETDDTSETSPSTSSKRPDTVTDTPASTETGETTASADYPTGLSSDGVSPLLVDYHVRNLESTTYTIDWREEYITDQRLVRNERIRVGDGQTLIDRDSDITDTDHYFTNGEETWRMTYRGARRYGHSNAQLPARRKLDPGFTKALIESVEFGEPETVTRDGGAAFRVESTQLSDPEGLQKTLHRVETVERIDATMLISPDGVIETLDSKLVYDDDGVEKLAEIEFTVSDVGTTSITKPEWLSTARKRAPDLTVTVSDDSTYLEYVHEGGQKIPKGARIALHGEPPFSKSEIGHLEQPFAPGERLYVWLEDGNVRWSRAETPDSATELGAEHFTLLGLYKVGYASVSVENL